MRLALPRTTTVTNVVIGLASLLSLIGGAVFPIAEWSGAAAAGSGSSSSPAVEPAPDADAGTDAGDATRASSVMQWTTVEESNAKVTYGGSGWSTLSNYNSSGKSVRFTTSAGASASMSFTGSGVRWVSWKAANAGITEVYLDSKLVATVDRYAASTSYQQVVFEKTGLSDGAHTIRIVSTGKRNAKATSNNLLLDAFQVQNATLLAAPVGPTVTPTGATGVTVRWSKVTGVAGYNVYRSIAGGAAVKINPALLTGTSYLDAGLRPGAAYRYSVKSVDSANQLSPMSASAAAVTLSDPLTPYRDAASTNCPTTATVKVTDAKTLQAALDKAVPGAVIRLADGLYRGNFKLYRAGTAEKPIWLCGGRGAVLEGPDGSYMNGAALRLANADYTVVDGFTIRNVMQAVQVGSSSHVRVSNLNIYRIGYEAIHLYDFTTDSVVAYNSISSTGLRDLQYGEGVYIGTSPARWNVVSDNKPDASNRNAVMGNHLWDIGAEPIEAKPMTVGGIVQDNVIDGHRAGSEATAWVQIAGSGWLVRNNVGTNAVTNGYRVGNYEDTSTGNVFDGNTGSVNASGWGVLIHVPGSPTPSGTFVSCDNVTSGAKAGSISIPCGG